jgi:hypothetical protein
MPQITLIATGISAEVVASRQEINLSESAYSYFLSQVQPENMEREVTCLLFEKAIPLSYRNRIRLKAIVRQCKQYLSQSGTPDPSLSQLFDHLHLAKYTYLQLAVCANRK